jgi:hypothetical protein
MKVSELQGRARLGGRRIVRRVNTRTGEDVTAEQVREAFN